MRINKVTDKFETDNSKISKKLKMNHFDSLFNSMSSSSEEKNKKNYGGYADASVGEMGTNKHSGIEFTIAIERVIVYSATLSESRCAVSNVPTDLDISTASSGVFSMSVLHFMLAYELVEILYECMPIRNVSTVNGKIRNKLNIVEKIYPLIDIVEESNTTNGGSSKHPKNIILCMLKGSEVYAIDLLKNVREMIASTHNSDSDESANVIVLNTEAINRIHKAVPIESWKNTSVGIDNQCQFIYISNIGNDMHQKIIEFTKVLCRSFYVPALIDLLIENPAKLRITSLHESANTFISQLESNPMYLDRLFFLSDKPTKISKQEATNDFESSLDLTFFVKDLRSIIARQHPSSIFSDIKAKNTCIHNCMGLKLLSSAVSGYRDR